jgi:hypothetical protein
LHESIERGLVEHEAAVVHVGLERVYVLAVWSAFRGERRGVAGSHE